MPVLWAFLLGTALVAGVTFALLRGSRAPAAIQHPAAPLTAIATWPAGTRRAPSFRLTDQHGAPVSLASLRGRTAIITFIDPVCRNLCPLEAKVLTVAARRLPAGDRPAIVSVSVNPWANTAANFRQDATHWQLGPGWRWAIGTEAQLTAVWRRYGIGVRFVKKVVTGIAVRSIVHTEGSYVVDRNGFERALFLYPFTASDVEQTLRRLATT